MSERIMIKKEVEEEEELSDHLESPEIYCPHVEIKEESPVELDKVLPRRSEATEDTQDPLAAESEARLEWKRHLEGKIKERTCATCGQEFRTKRIMLRHMTKHIQEKARECDVCGKCFQYKRILMHHMKVHTGEKPHKCEVCGKAFSDNSALIIHNRLHTGERPYSCVSCSKSFIAKSNLRNHEKKEHSASILEEEAQESKKVQADLEEKLVTSEDLQKVIKEERTVVMETSFASTNEAQYAQVIQEGFQKTFHPCESSCTGTTALTKQLSYTVEFKLKAVEFLRENGNNVSVAARKFKVDRKRIREWRDNYPKLLLHSTGKDKDRRTLHKGAAPLSDDLDMALYNFLEEERSNGRAVSNDDLMRFASDYARKAKVPQNFKASAGWLRRWKNRFDVGMRSGTNTSHFVPADHAEKISAFRLCVKELRIKENYAPINIACMDQTIVRFDCPTNNSKGDAPIQTLMTSSHKKGCTVVLCATASGHKLPVFVIFKERNGILEEKVWRQLQIPSNVKIDATPNGWMTSAKLHTWVRHVWGKSSDSVRRLLVLDQYRPHLTGEAKEVFGEMDTDLVHIPGGCTALLQPMDVSINKPFKVKVSELWREWTEATRDNSSENLLQPTRQDVLQWISVAWDSISKELIEMAFKRCGISNALDDSEEALVRQDVSDEMDEQLPSDASDGYENFDDDVDFAGWGDDE